MLSLSLAAFMHLDWHLARGTHHGGLSFGLTASWLLAVPVFASVAWLARRLWRDNALRRGLGVIALGALIGQALEPGAELLAGATLDWTFGAERLGAFVRYVLTGMAAFLVTLWALRLSPRSDRSPAGRDPRDRDTLS